MGGGGGGEKVEISEQLCSTSICLRYPDNNAGYIAIDSIIAFFRNKAKD